MVHLYELWVTITNYGLQTRIMVHFWINLPNRIMVHFYELWYTTTNYGIHIRIMDYFMRFLYSSGTLFLLLPFSAWSYLKVLCIPFFCNALRDDIWKMLCFENDFWVLEFRVTFRWIFWFERWLLVYEKGIRDGPFVPETERRKLNAYMFHTGGAHF